MLADNFWYANGVAVARDQSFVAVAETTSMSVHKYWLNGPKVPLHLPYMYPEQTLHQLKINPNYCTLGVEWPPSNQVANLAGSKVLHFDFHHRTPYCHM